MKTYVLSMVLNLVVVASLSGKIMNGYQPEISTARDGFKNLNALILQNSEQSAKAKSRNREYLERLREFILYYELTEKLLDQFKMIVPEIYGQIDTLKDAQGRPVDVYIMFLPSEKMNGTVAGYTNVPLDSEGDAYHSKFGMNTAFVQIVTGKDALNLLAHEFGHLKYQVPNIAAYRKIYKKYYQIERVDSEGIGHHHMDPSGQQAFELERKFRLEYDRFLKLMQYKFERPLAIVKQIDNDLK